MEPYERLKIIIKQLNFKNYREFGNRINIKEGTIQQITSNKQKVSLELALTIKKEFGVSASWLLFGEDSDGISMKIDENDEKFYQIKFYEDVRASAGFGTDCEEMYSSELIILPASAIKEKINPKKVHAIKVIGESMNPRIHDGDVAFVEVGVEFVNDGAVYVIKIEEDIYIKRLYKSPNNMYIIKSDNKEFPEFQQPRNNVNIIGKVVYLLSEFTK